MSFYTALTGLNGSSADISATSNNIANVGTTGFKRSRVEFGDIFATSPLQNASSSIGSGAILKGIKQQFTQGNIAASLNALDLAISGQGFFALKPSLTSAQTVYTRNGSLNVNNDRYVVDSAGQFLLTYPVNTDGSVTAKDLDSAVPLQLPVTSGDPQATSNIKLGVNVNAASDVVTDRPQFQDGYNFDPNDPESFTNSTSITIFDDLGNPTIATVYFIKTQAASADDPTNKYDTRLVINDTIINPDLVSAVDDAGKQIFVDRFGQQTTTIPDDNYFIEGKGSPLYKLDDLQTLVPSQPAKISGEASSFDFGEEGDKLVEIVTDPLRFDSTREGGNTAGDMYWGKDFLLVNVDESDQPVSIDINPGLYNAQQLASEVERAINAAYGDDRKFQVEQNVDNIISFNFERVGADGTPAQLDQAVEVELLGIDSFVTEQMSADPDADFAITSTSPDFTKEEFLSHAQIRINESLNAYGREQTGDPMGIKSLQFAKSKGEAMTSPYEYTQVVTLERTDDSGDPHYLVYSYADSTPSISVASVMDEVKGNPADLNVEYDSTNDRLRIYLAHNDGAGTSSSNWSNVDMSNYEVNSTITLAGNASFNSQLNGRSFVVLATSDPSATTKYIDVSTSGLTIGDSIDDITGADDLFILTNPSSNPPQVEAFFEGSSPIYPGAKERFYSNKIVVREKQGNAADTSKGSFVASAWNIENTTTAYTAESSNTLAQNMANLGLEKLHRPAILKEPSASLATTNNFTLDLKAGNDTLTVTTGAIGATAAGTALSKLKDALKTYAEASSTDLAGYSFTFVNSAGETLFGTGAYKLNDSGAVVYDNANDNWRNENQSIFTRAELGITAALTGSSTVITDVIVSRDDNADFELKGGAAQNFRASIAGEDATSFNALNYNGCNNNRVGEFISGLG